MGCLSCGQNQALINAQIHQHNYDYNNTLPLNSEPCDITLVILKSWKDILVCVKNLGGISNLSIVQINSYLGYVQSAINYPDYYCYYRKPLEEFQNIILPQIISNAPECIQ